MSGGPNCSAKSGSSEPATEARISEDVELLLVPPRDREHQQPPATPTNPPPASTFRHRKPGNQTRKLGTTAQTSSYPRIHGFTSTSLLGKRKLRFCDSPSDSESALAEAEGGLGGRGLGVGGDILFLPINST